MANWYDLGPAVGFANLGGTLRSNDPSFRASQESAAIRALEGVLRRSGLYSDGMIVDGQLTPFALLTLSDLVADAGDDGLSGMGWNNPQQAAAAQEMFATQGYEGLRQMGYDLPEMDRSGSDPRAMSRHLMPPEQYKALQARRDIDLIRGVLSEGGESPFRSGEEVDRALEYHQGSRHNPFTHSDYGSPNYAAFDRDMGTGVANFFNDPQNNVSNALMGMDAVPATVLNAMENDQGGKMRASPAMFSGHPLGFPLEMVGSAADSMDNVGEALGRRLSRGAEQTMANFQARNVFREGPVSIADLPNDASPDALRERLQQIREMKHRSASADGQQALSGVGVPDAINTPLVGMGAMIGVNAVDPSPLGTAVGAMTGGGKFGPAFARDLTTDAAFNVGMASVLPAPERTWQQFVEGAYERPSQEDQYKRSSEITRSSAELMGRKGLTDYAAEARGVAGGSEDKIRGLLEMYNRPFQAR